LELEEVLKRVGPKSRRGKTGFLCQEQALGNNQVSEILAGRAIDRRSGGIGVVEEKLRSAQIRPTFPFSRLREEGFRAGEMWKERSWGRKPGREDWREEVPFGNR